MLKNSVVDSHDYYTPVCIPSEFNQYDLEVPETIDEYMEVCQTLLDNGVIPIAFGVKDFSYGWQFWDRVVTVVAGMEEITEMLSGPGKLGGPATVETLRIMREFAQKGYLGDALSFGKSCTISITFMPVNGASHPCSWQQATVHAKHPVQYS